MEQSLDRRQLLKKAGTALGAGVLLGAAVVTTERPARATTYSHTLMEVYYIAYPPFFTDPYHLSVEGEAKGIDGSTVIPPDFFLLHIQDKDGNYIYAPHTTPILLGPPTEIDVTSTGFYTRGGLSLPGPLDAGSVRIWMDAYWGVDPSNYTHMERSAETYGLDTDPNANAFIPCYSGC